MVVPMVSRAIALNDTWVGIAVGRPYLMMTAKNEENMTRTESERSTTDKGEEGTRSENLVLLMARERR